MRAWFGIYLCWLSFQDMREKAVSVWKLLAGAGVIIICRIGSQKGLPSIADLLPGLLGVAVAAISREQIGYTDGIVLLLMGMGCGWRKSSCIAFGAMISASLWGIGKACVKKQSRGIRVAWLPFLTLHYEILEVWDWMKGI